MITNFKKVLVTLSVTSSLLSTSLLAQTSDQMVESIMKLRNDVESLYSDIKENKQRYDSTMNSLSMQKTDTDAQINRKTTEIKLANSELDKVKDKIKDTASGNSEIKPLVLNSLQLLEETIKSGIPFMVESRVAALNKIKSDMEEGLITNEKALALTWASYDDAIRLTKEIGLFKQQINFKGQNVLAKIAKIGSVMMYFSTPSEDVGYVVKENEKYSYKHITDPDDISKIVAIFDALQKQIRTGYFELPNALVLQETK